MNERWLTALFWLWHPQSPAQYHPGPASLGCPNRCDPSSQCTVWQDHGWAGVVGGLWSTSALIHPTIKTLWKTNICLAKVKALEPGAHLSVCPGSHSFIPACFVLGFFVRASTLPHSFGQDIKRDQGGSDSQPFPTRRVTTASCLDYDNSGWKGRRSGKVGKGWLISELPLYSELCVFLPVIGSHYFMGRLELLHSGI